MARLIALLLFACSAIAAQAGDYAERRIIGFSANGKYFAFQQFGVQDGSGFPYSEIFIINTDTDTWAGGSPFRARIDDESATLEDARRRNAGQAREALHNLGIRQPGRLLASNPPTQTGVDAKRVGFRLYPGIDPVMAVRVRNFPLSAPNCADFDVTTRGFALALDTGDGRPQKILHRDTRIPSSRNCPVGYDISDVLYHERGGTNRLIVLINVFSLGFEGNNRRFIAIPARF